MKYTIVRQDGITEVREDSNPLQEGAILITDEQYSQLIDGQYIVQNGQIVINPNPPNLL